ncbi:M20 family peptidase [Hahella ganghwensis]|uniref:M20 family peptidase n=1 Tax=Hahella ganghwensis TaxID=286420 RepID=UPI00035EC801|nr:M20 family peptidase [Hahella ganghwensis]
MVKKILAGCLALLLISVVAVLLRTLTLSPEPAAVVEAFDVRVHQDQVIGRLSQAIQFKTVSQVLPAKDGNPPRTLVDAEVFSSFHGFLEQSFPAVHERLERIVLNEFSLLYRWQGSEPQKPPILLTAHQDVVPYSLPDLEAWEHPPFSGALEDGFVWGRGTLDDKSSMIAILEAVEGLLEQGWQPSRTVYLAFGHDEEVGGTGAAAIADYLHENSIRPELVLDEGGFVMRSMIPGVSQPVGLIGIAEKGYLSVELQTEGKVGHSSMPPPQTAASIISAAVVNLERHPPAKRLDGATLRLFETVSPHMSFGKRAVFANLWLFEPLVLSILESKESTNATIRSTQAVTMLNSGHKDNVLPATATAVVNYRLLPDDSVDDILEHIRNTINDERVAITVYPYHSEASQVSDTENALYQAMVGAGLGVFREQDMIMAPYLTIGATDARHYQEVTKNQYRFLPIPLDREDLSRIHGPNERIAVEDYLRMIRFYVTFLKSSDAVNSP